MHPLVPGVPPQKNLPPLFLHITLLILFFCGPHVGRRQRFPFFEQFHQVAFGNGGQFELGGRPLYVTLVVVVVLVEVCVAVVEDDVEVLVEVVGDNVGLEVEVVTVVEM